MRHFAVRSHSTRRRVTQPKQTPQDILLSELSVVLNQVLNEKHPRVFEHQSCMWLVCGDPEKLLCRIFVMLFAGYFVTICEIFFDQCLARPNPLK